MTSRKVLSKLLKLDTEKDEAKVIIFPEYREGCIPLYTLRAACGYFEDGESLKKRVG